MSIQRKYCDMYHDGNILEVKKAIKDGLITLPQIFNFYSEDYSSDLFDLRLLVERLSS